MRRLLANLRLGTGLLVGVLLLFAACSGDSRKVYYGPSGSRKHYHAPARVSYPQKSTHAKKDRDDRKDRHDTKDVRSKKQTDKKKSTSGKKK